MLQGVLDRLRGARELTLKRLYKLALRKALGNFLAGQLGVDQLDVQLVMADGDNGSSSTTRLGLVQLTDLEVNAAALNSYLAGRPLRLVRGTLARVEVRVCYEKLLTEEGLKVTVEGLDLLLAPAPPDSDSAGAGTAAASAASRRRREGLEEPSSSDEEEQQEKPPASASGVEADSATGIIADWIEQVAAQLRVEAKGLTVRVLGSSEAAAMEEDAPLLRLDVGRAVYEDVTARYQGHSGGGGMSASMVGGGDGPAGAAAGHHGPSPCVSHKRIAFEGLQVHLEHGGPPPHPRDPQRHAKRRQRRQREQRRAPAAALLRILEVASEGQVDVKVGRNRPDRPAEVAKLDLRLQVAQGGVKAAVSPEVIRDVKGLLRAFVEAAGGAGVGGGKGEGPLVDLGPFLAWDGDGLPDVGELDFGEIERVLKHYVRAKGLGPLDPEERRWRRREREEGLEDEEFFDCANSLEASLFASVHEGEDGPSKPQPPPSGQEAGANGGRKRKGGSSSSKGAPLRLRVDAMEGELTAYASDAGLASGSGPRVALAWTRLFAASGPAIGGGRVSTLFSVGGLAVHEHEHCSSPAGDGGPLPPSLPPPRLLLGFDGYPPLGGGGARVGGGGGLSRSIFGSGETPLPAPLEGTVELRHAAPDGAQNKAAPHLGVDLRLRPFHMAAGLGGLKRWLGLFLPVLATPDDEVGGSGPGLCLRVTCPRARLHLPLTRSMLAAATGPVVALRAAFAVDEEERARWAVVEGAREGAGPGVELLLGRGWGADGDEEEEEEEEEERGEGLSVDVNPDGGMHVGLGGVQMALLLALAAPKQQEGHGPEPRLRRLSLMRAVGGEENGGGGKGPFLRVCPWGQAGRFGYAPSLTRALAPALREWEAVEREGGEGDLLGAGEPRPLPTVREEDPVLHLHLPDLGVELTHVERFAAAHVLQALLNEPVPAAGGALPLPAPEGEEELPLLDQEAADEDGDDGNDGDVSLSPRLLLAEGGGDEQAAAAHSELALAVPSQTTEEAAAPPPPPTAAAANTSSPQPLPLLVTCGATLLRLHETAATALDPSVAASPEAITIVLEGLCLYSIGPGAAAGGSSGGHFRATAHDLTLTEAAAARQEKGNGALLKHVPVLYKNKWVPPPPQHAEGEGEPPLVVLDMVDKEQEGGNQGVLSAHLDLYGVALRLRVESQWLPRAVTLLAGGVETLSPAIRGTKEEEEEEEEGEEAKPPHEGGGGAVMRVFCTAYDSVVDYDAAATDLLPPNNSGNSNNQPSASAAAGGSRAVLSFGLARASSTLVTGAPRQAYKAMLRDLVLHVSGEPAEYATEDAALLGSRRLGLSPPPPPAPAVAPPGTTPPSAGVMMGSSPYLPSASGKHGWRYGTGPIAPGRSDYFSSSSSSSPLHHYHHHPAPAPALLSGFADPYRPQQQHYHYPLPGALLAPASPARVEEGASVQQCLERRGFVQLATLNFVDASLRCLASAAPMATEPAVTLELSIGLLLLYTCGDSFTTLQEALGGAWCRLQAERDRLERVRLGLPPVLLSEGPSQQQQSTAPPPAASSPLPPKGVKEWREEGEEGPRTIAMPVVGVPRQWTDEVANEASRQASSLALPIAITAGNVVAAEEGGTIAYGSSHGSSAASPKVQPGSVRPKSYLEDIDEEMFVPTAGDAVAAATVSVVPGPAPAASADRPLAPPSASSQQEQQQQSTPPLGLPQNGSGAAGNGVRASGLGLGQMLIDDFYEMSAGAGAAAESGPSSSLSGGEAAALLGLGAEGPEEEGWGGGWFGGPGVDLRAGQRGQHPDIFDEGFLVEVDEFDAGDVGGSSRPRSAASGGLGPAASLLEEEGDGVEEEDEEELSVNLELDPGVPGGLFAAPQQQQQQWQRRMRRMSLVEGMGPEMELDPLGALHDGKGGLGLLALDGDGGDDGHLHHEEAQPKQKRRGEEEVDATDLSSAAAAAVAAAASSGNQQEEEQAAVASAPPPPPPPALPPGPPPPGAPDDAAWAWDSAVTPGQEQCTRWFVEGVRVFPHHVPQPAEELLARNMDALALVPFDGGGDRGAEDGGGEGEGRRSRGAGGEGGGGVCPVQFRLVLQDVSVRWRMFAGHDWGEPAVLSSSSSSSSSTSSGQPPHPAAEGGYRASERLRGLFGEEGEAGALQQRQPPPQQPRQRWRRKKRKGQGRKTDCMVEVCLSHVSARLDGMAPGTGQASVTVVRVLDFHVLDRINTVQPRRILGYWRSDTEHPRDAKDRMLELELTALLPTYDACVGLSGGDHQQERLPAGPPIEELVLRARLLPLRCHVDQHTLDFLAAFFTLAAASAAVPPTTNPHTKAAASASEAFFQAVHIRRVKVKLDTQTRPLDVREVQRGNYAELLNLCPLKGVKLELAPVRLRGASGWAAVLDGVRDSWLRDVTQKQMLRLLMGPSAIRSVFNVGAGMADLVLIPLREYRKDGRLLRGLRKGAVRCLRNITIEALNASVGLTKAVATTLNDLVSDAPPSALLLPASSSTGGGGGGGDSGGAAGAGGPGRRLIEPGPQPRGVRDGLEHAYDSLTRGLNSAAHTIIAVPIQELERSGPRGSVRAVFRALPIAVVRPVAGATEALSITLLGVRNKIDPSARREEEELWRV